MRKFCENGRICKKQTEKFNINYVSAWLLVFFGMVKRAVRIEPHRPFGKEKQEIQDRSDKNNDSKGARKAKSIGRWARSFFSGLFGGALDRFDDRLVSRAEGGTGQILPQGGILRERA